MHYLSQEIEVWYIIPALRREISKCLIKDFQISYEKTGNMLGITKAAISQYVKGKRASKIKLPKEIGPKILSSCKSLSKKKTTSSEEINKLLKYIRDKSLPCEVCGHIKEGVFEDCKEIRYSNGRYNPIKPLSKQW